MKAQQGFSLLEVIVAFLVFALIAAVVLAIASRGLSGAEQTARYQHAVMLAESLLDRAGAERLGPGAHAGTAPGGYRWRLDIESVPGSDGPELRLLHAQVQVSLEDGRSVSLSTLLASPP